MADEAASNSRVTALSVAFAEALNQRAIPINGETGQQLRKLSDANFDVGWTYAGTGDVTGPDASVDGALAVFDGTGGLVIKEGPEGTAGQVLTSNGAGAAPTFEDAAAGGDVSGPASATDNAITRYDGTTGKLVQNSTVTVDDAGRLDAAFVVSSGNIRLAGTGAILFNGRADIQSPTTDSVRVTGASGSVDFTVGASSLLTTNGGITSGGPITATGGTVTASTPPLVVSQTWNNAAVVFTGLQANITALACDGASMLMDLRANGSSKFRVDPTGGCVMGDLYPSNLFLGGGQLSTVASAAVIRTGTSLTAVMTPGYLYSAVGLVTLTSATTVTPDLGAGINFTLTASHNVTLANPTNLKQGESGVIYFIQDGTGSRTIAFGSGWKFPGGAPTASTAANAVDCIAYFVRDAATPLIDAVYLKAFA